ncbi:MAG TPA: DUF3152 domain-containing protein [Propionibacteriaceae bacterium]|nr:DUF3152 domain-containing protein [Propionibacteriaceae bacterium]
MIEISGSQSNPHHAGHIRSDPSAAMGLAAKRRRSAIGLVAGIIALGLVGLCLRIVPTVLTNAKLMAEIGVPITSIPAAVSSSAAPATPTPRASARRYDPAQTGNSPRGKLQTKPKAKGRSEVMVPDNGPGTYAGAKTAVKSASSYGRLIRYDVRVEDGLPIDPDEAAALIQQVLDDKRSWRGTGRWRFELATIGESASLHAYLATPDTTDKLCAPLLTRGELSCRRGERVVLNAKRWLIGADSYGSDLTNYRRYLVNHEFGHVLGKGHVDCPGPGRQAPLMMQQTKGLGGCRKNPWP